MIAQTGGANGGSAMSPYEYAVAGGFTGTEDEFKAALGEGPWLRRSQWYPTSPNGYSNITCLTPNNAPIPTAYEGSFDNVICGGSTVYLGDPTGSTTSSTMLNNIFALGNGVTLSGTLMEAAVVGFNPNASELRASIVCGDSLSVVGGQGCATFGHTNTVVWGAHNSGYGSFIAGYYNYINKGNVYDGGTTYSLVPSNSASNCITVFGYHNILGCTSEGYNTANQTTIIGDNNRIVSSNGMGLNHVVIIGSQNCCKSESDYQGALYTVVVGNNCMLPKDQNAIYNEGITIAGFVNNPDSSKGSFVVGAGTRTYNSSTQSYTSTGKNGLRVDQTNVYGLTYRSSGADYAEMFQWQDGNPNNEDRAGHFVTLDGEYIKLAGPKDKFVLGIISGNPSIVGDVHDDQWHGIDDRDIFGRPIYEDVEVPEETEEVPDPQNLDQTITRVKVPAHTEHRVKTNPDYNPDEKYIPRSQRSEWGTVGMMGKLVAVDDGTCQINGYAKVGIGGIATHSDEDTRYRVMARLDDTHIRVLIL